MNRFTLSFVSQPWNQTTYVSLSKELVNSWMVAFYDAQHARENGNVVMDPLSSGQADGDVRNGEVMSVSMTDHAQDEAMVSDLSVSTSHTLC